MIYPAYIHLGDKDHSHGVTLPDFEGCFSAADHYDDITKQTQEAVELYFEGEDIDLPSPSDITKLEASGEYKDGVWMLIDIDTSRLEGKAKRLNISLPGHVVRRMDRFAHEQHLTRSTLIAKATEAFINQQSDLPQSRTP